MQVDPVTPKLTPPGTKRLKLRCDILVSTSAFKFDVRRYMKAAAAATAADLRSAELRSAPLAQPAVGRCRLTVSKPVLKAPTVSALEATI